MLSCTMLETLKCTSTLMGHFVFIFTFDRLKMVQPVKKNQRFSGTTVCSHSNLFKTI